jgi:hypothetical protein
LGKIAKFSQGVTFGGNSQELYLVGSGVACESTMLVKAAEAEDIDSWVLKDTGKLLIYPYDSKGAPAELGDLGDDLTAEQALRSIEAQIASGVIAFPMTATYLARYYERLSSRVAEKKPFSAYGKRWFEYHRPRDRKILCSHPKIITRRMTKDVEFALDLLGVVPTDGCILLTLRDDSSWLQKALAAGVSRDGVFRLLLGILNSSIVKYLLKSRQDSWQGGFYQVPEAFLETIPIPNIGPRTLKEIASMTRLVDEFLRGTIDSEAIDHSVAEIFGVSDQRAAIQEYLTSR